MSVMTRPASKSGSLRGSRSAGARGLNSRASDARVGVFGAGLGPGGVFGAGLGPGGVFGAGLGPGGVFGAGLGPGGGVCV